MNYKDVYSLANVDSEFNAMEWWTENINVADVVEFGTVRVTSTGSAEIYGIDYDGNTRCYIIEADYSFFQWIILILFFGWLWY